MLGVVLSARAAQNAESPQLLFRTVGTPQKPGRRATPGASGSFSLIGDPPPPPRRGR